MPADHPFDSARRQAPHVVGAMPGQEFVEDDAEGIDIRRCGDSLAAHLFGARVFGGHHAHAGAGHREGFGGAVFVE